ncbi:response regulator [Myxococcota bacterium]|nr:response regulator [Myxococcota bacterium]
MSKRVLLVDDSATVRQQLRQALIPAGFEIVEAVDGEEGLEHLLHTSDLSMAICDVNMPRMDGIEMVQRAYHAGIRVPILMLTTEGQPSLIRKAKEVGAKGWIVKPFQPDLLVKAVHKLAL